MVRRIKLVATLLALSLSHGAMPTVLVAHDPPEAREIDLKADEPVVQIALLLDTSNSMDGLINQARTQLWKIVNQFNHCKHHGAPAKLQVALYEYGNNNLAAGEGYIRMVLPLTTDLDMVSDKLWSLKTNGGEEYCGQVIHNSVAELRWNPGKQVYRALFIAGNEPFTQGQLDYHRACAEALGKGIVVNTIHCGPEAVGREGKWDDGARIGEGRFLNIDQDRVCVAIPAPQDDDLAKLSTELNSTYIPYGSGSAGRLELQRAQDRNAASAGPAANSERSITKANGVYTNGGWDLVDAAKQKDFSLSSTDEASLPREMQSMTPDQRRDYIAQQTAKRQAIQDKINHLAAEREKFLAEASKKEGKNAADTLDSAMLKAIQEQLEKQDFKTE